MPTNWNRNGALHTSTTPNLSTIHPGYPGVYLHRLDTFTSPSTASSTTNLPSYKFGCAKDIAQRLCTHSRSAHCGGELDVIATFHCTSYRALEAYGIRYLSSHQNDQWGTERTCRRAGDVARKELFHIADVDAFKAHLLRFEQPVRELTLDELDTSQCVLYKHMRHLVNTSATATEPYRIRPGTTPLTSNEYQARRAHFAFGPALHEVVMVTARGGLRMRPEHAFGFVKGSGKGRRYGMGDLRYDLGKGVVGVGK